MNTLTLHLPGKDHSLAPEALAETLNSARAMRGLPFDAKRMRLVEQFSDKLMNDPRFAQSVALRAFAFWTRKSALTQLHNRFNERLPQQALAVGRGIAFHLPPANVDTLFFYSWVIAFLTGNVNVTRLPSAFTGPVSDALQLLLSLLEEGGFPDAFVSYPAGDDINRILSQIADIRLVWGGDAKAETFAAIPLRIGARSLVFPDRYSYAIIDGEFLRGLDDESVRTLSRDMFNDLFVFNQMACSSPHTLYVVGNKAQHGDALHRLLQEVDAVAQIKDMVIPASHALEKFAAAARMAGNDEVTEISRFSNQLTSVDLSTLAATPSIGGGFLGIAYLSNINDLAERVQQRHQTLTYAGFTHEQTMAFAQKAATRGLSRIVPVGRALEFDALWDGQDLLMETITLIKVS